MGIYARKDSPFWWAVLEGTSTRFSTGVPIRGGSPQQDREHKRQAETIYAARKTAVAMRAEGLHAEKPQCSYTVFSAWFAQHDVAHHRGAAKERSMLRQLLAYFGARRLTEIDADAVKEWMTVRKRQVQPATVNRELDVLKRLLRAAVPKYLDASPIAGLRRFRLEETEPRVLTPDEEDRLLRIAAPIDKALVIMALDTLLRLSSCLTLQWAQVKFDDGVIVPLNAKVKTDNAPITLRLALALKALGPSTGAVFEAFHRTGQTAAKNLAIRRFDALCRRAEIPHGRDVGGVTFHCLRHTGATRALQRGASVRTVMKLGGWKDERSVMRYVHAADADVRAAAESISIHVRRA
jgi:integrase